MSTRTKEILVVAIVAALFLIFYLRKVFGAPPVLFPGTVSILVVSVIGLSLLWILIRTLAGRYVERRVVFLYVGIAVTLPLFMTLSQKVSVAPEVQGVFSSFEKLSAGSKVLVSFDYDPPSAPELQPMAEACLYYCFEHDLKVIIMGLWPQGPMQANLALQKVLNDERISQKNLQYGVDYVNLGFQAGNEFVIQRMGSEFRSMFPADFRGTPYEEIPLVTNIRNFSNIDYSFNIGSGYPGTREWVQIAVDRYGLKLGAGNTAVQTTEMYPYLRAGQLAGIVGGMSGAAEFEFLTKWIGNATKFMLAQSVAHMIVISFVIIGNVAFFVGRRTRERKS
ncbi:MAG TPA: hypothetical protein VN285_12480 [Candidatus Deferrimicrobium sp.]|nr:hypothetical protein [Candidatus Deferrimicrobium sp.]